MRRMATRFLLLAVLAASSVPAFAYNQVVSRSFPLAPRGRIELKNVNGSVRITGWNRNFVELRAVKRTEKEPADLLRVRVRVTATPNDVSIQTRYPKDEVVPVSVEYSLLVPHHALLHTVETVNGAVLVRRMDGQGELRSVNGNVEILDSAGGFTAHTTNGNLRMELRRLDPQTPLEGGTVNGSVVLALAPTAGAVLRIHTLNGNFHSDLPVHMLAGGSVRQFRGTLGHGGAPLSLHTVNGAIRIIRLPPAA